MAHPVLLIGRPFRNGKQKQIFENLISNEMVKLFTSLGKTFLNIRNILSQINRQLHSIIYLVEPSSSQIPIYYEYIISYHPHVHHRCTILF